MGRDSQPTVVDAWGAQAAGDDQHQADRPQRPFEETEDTLLRFRFATERRNQRRRIPLSSNRALRILTVHAEPPPARMPDGSSTAVRRVRELPPIAVEVRLRRNHPPTTDQVEDVLAWLRTHRIPSGTPRPEPVAPPPPAPPLQPVIALEPPRRGSLWPLLAVSAGLATALLAAILL